MKSIFSLFLIVSMLASCASTPQPTTLLRPPPDNLARRQMETRRFDIRDEEKMLAAAVGVLQDMGYVISETAIDLGLITATMDREATTAGQRALVTGAAVGGAVALGLLFGGNVNMSAPVQDVDQNIFATLVSTKSGDGFNVRVQFIRRITNTAGETRSERITDATVYQEFFNKLAQSLFLTAHNL